MADPNALVIETARDEIRWRIETLRKQAGRSREEAELAERLARTHHGDAISKDLMADQYAAILEGMDG